MGIFYSEPEVLDYNLKATKKCTACFKEKNLSDFRLRKNKSYFKQCRTCRKYFHICYHGEQIWKCKYHKHLMDDLDYY